MSRAFVNENTAEQAPEELPERPLSSAPNYVTPHGLGLLRARLEALQQTRDQLLREDQPLARQQLLEAKRDLRYVQAQLERAVAVDPAGQPRDEVHFGATVTIRGEDHHTQRFHIVGDDEADAATGSISWNSPLAKALMGASIGDTVTWQRPAGATEVEIVAIDYAPAA
jgi:transcription elongation GreA/GreB family factor